MIDYGSGAIMGVPAHDQRDKALADHFNIKYSAVIENDILINSA